MIYSHNNAAKEWIFRELAKRAQQGPLRVLDLACGAGSTWRLFLKDHPTISYMGSDTDAVAVAKAQKEFADIPNARFEVADAQSARNDAGQYDVVTALSSLEHVVRIDKFLDTVFAALKPGGVAYLNYDDGHFYSRDIKERIMVPVSQLLAKVGIEGPYMKEVKDADVVRMIRERGGDVLAIHKNHVDGLKGAMKSFGKESVNEAALEAWFAFEDRLNEVAPMERLADIMGATTIVMQKP